MRRLLQEDPLEAEEERRLAVLARAGDDAARDVLLRRSLRLVALRVRALGFRGDDVDDAFQVGAFALMAAVGRYDPDRGARLATYAWPWITRALQAHRVARREVPHAVLPEPRVPSEPAGRQAWDHLAVLTEQEREVLAARFATTPDGVCPVPWDDVAGRLGVSASTARRVGDRAVSRLRARVGTVTHRAPRVGDSPP